MNPRRSLLHTAVSRSLYRRAPTGQKTAANAGWTSTRQEQGLQGHRVHSDSVLRAMPFCVRVQLMFEFFAIRELSTFCLRATDGGALPAWSWVQLPPGVILLRTTHLQSRVRLPVNIRATDCCQRSGGLLVTATRVWGRRTLRSLRTSSR